MRSPTFRHQTVLLGLLAADLVCVGGSYAMAMAFRLVLPLPFTAELLPAERLTEIQHPFLFLLATQGVVLYFFSLYDLHTLQLRGRVASRAMSACGLQLLLTTAWYFFRGDVYFPRSVLVLFWAFNSSMISVLRSGLIKRLGQTRSLRIVLVGTAKDAKAFLDLLPVLRPFPALHIAGLVSLNGLNGLHPHTRQTDQSDMQGAGKAVVQEDLQEDLREDLGVPWLGDASELERIVREVQVDDVILLASTTWKDAFVERLLGVSADHADERRPRVLVVPSVYDILVGRVASLRLRDVPLVEVIKDPHEDLSFLLKSAFDRLMASVLFVVSLPILGVAAVLIASTSHGPIFYCQQRVGKGGEEFTLYKLRTMVDGAEAKTGPVLASQADQRVTSVGRLLRDSRIDELPQLWNVLNGTMSLVGPRPERPQFAKQFLQDTPGYAERFWVKPGLTGLAQVNGEYHTTPEYKLKYDLAYMYNYSMWLDIRILSDTIKVILTRRGI